VPVDGLKNSLVLETLAVLIDPEVFAVKIIYRVALEDVSSVRVTPPAETVAHV
jgi:hypothetical protein